MDNTSVSNAAAFGDLPAVQNYLYSYAGNIGEKGGKNKKLREQSERSDLLRRTH